MGRRLLFIEPFYGGSHRQFADALKKRSSWNVELATMPARFWRWRRRLSAFEIVRRMETAGLSPADFDLILVSDYVDIGDLRALFGPLLPPVIWYCHETQSTYPLPKGRTVEADVVATDMRNALHADAIAFNSAFHRDAFFEVYRNHAALLQRWEPEWRIPSLDDKSRVIYPGVDCSEAPDIEEVDTAKTLAAADTAAKSAGDPTPGAAPPGAGPIILWNHRWEYDKNFGAFFSVASRLAKKGVPFRLALLGENPQAKPQTFLKARTELADRLVAFGYAKDKNTYEQWLRKSDIVVSSAIQENFGIAILEAMSRGCIPLLPRRLAYPEILPEVFHDSCLYDSASQLEEKLEALLLGHEGQAPAADIARAARQFCWDERIEDFDAWFESCAVASPEGPSP